MKGTPAMWCRRGLFCPACLLFEAPAGLDVAVVDFLVSLGFAGLDERRKELVVDVDSGLASVAVGSDEADAVAFLLGLLYCNVAGASVP